MAAGAWRSEGGRGRPRTAGGVVIQAGVSQGGWFALHRLFLRTSRLKGQTLILIEGGAVYLSVDRSLRGLRWRLGTM